MRYKTVAKFIVALLGAGLTAASGLTLPQSVRPWVTILTAMVTAGGVYWVPNEAKMEPSESAPGALP